MSLYKSWEYLYEKDIMKTIEPKNKLEQLNREYKGMNFIKKYDVLTTTDLKSGHINVIELILSYQLANQVFYMTRKRMGEILGVSEGSIKNRVSELKKMKLVQGEQMHNPNHSGSKAFLVVDMDALCAYIESSQEKKEPAPQPSTPEVPVESQPEPAKQEAIEEVPQPLQEVQEVVDHSNVDDDEEFFAEIGKILGAHKIGKGSKDREGFNPEEWLRSFDEEIGEYHEDIYKDLIQEVSNRYKYKEKITQGDYIQYFRWGNFKESHTESLGHLIYEAHKRKKRAEYSI